MLERLRALARNEKGATAIEYGLIIALVVIAMVVAMVGLGNSTRSMWNNVSSRVNSAS